MELRQLRLLLAVVEHGSFTKAAQAAFISQPAVSQAISDLEREVGTRLLVRLGRRIEPTAAGEAFCAHARVALRELQAAQDAVEDRIELRQGHLDITALRTLAAVPVAELVGTYRRKYPGVTVNLAAPDNPVHLVEHLRSGTAEVAITEAATLPSDLIVHSLQTEELVVIIPPDHPDLPDPLPVEQLARLALVVTPPGTSSRAHLDTALANIGTTAELGVVTAQREAILPLVLAGAGAALVPAPLASVARQLGARSSAVLPPLTRQLVIAHRDAPLTPAAKAFMKTVTGL